MKQLLTLIGELQKYGLDIHHCANINIFISSIDTFARVNAVYGSFFGSSPPARACVAVALPNGIQVKLDAIAFIEKRAGDRQAHHVQGLSYWAPANIGPYSQAILVCFRTRLSSLRLSLIAVTGSRTRLRLRANWPGPQKSHSGRYSPTADSLVMPACGKDCPSAGFQHRVELARYPAAVDLLVHTYEGSFIREVRCWCFGGQQTQFTLWFLSILITKQENDVPTIFVAVKALPKDAKVERQTLYHTGRQPPLDYDNDEDPKPLLRRDISGS